MPKPPANETAGRNQPEPAPPPESPPRGAAVSRRTATGMLLGMGGVVLGPLPGEGAGEGLSSPWRRIAAIPSTPSGSGRIDLLTIPYDGLWEGWPKQHVGNNSSRVGARPKGGRFLVRRSGTITEWHFQMASNYEGETSKSTHAGMKAHGYSAAWDYRLDILPGNPAWQITGDPLFSRDFRVNSANGARGVKGYSRAIMAFTEATHGLSIPVRAGQHLLWRLTNLADDPDNNACSINAFAVYPKNGIRWVGPGARPPEASGLFHGDGNHGCYFDGDNTEAFNQLQNIVAVRYSDGVEDGDISMDATNTVFGAAIDAANIVDQSWSAPYWRRASSFIVSAWQATPDIPRGPLRVTVSGADITTRIVDIPPSLIPVRDGILRAREMPFTTPLTLSPGTIYRVVLSSPDTSGSAPFRICAGRSAGYLSPPGGSPPRMTPPPAGYRPIGRHDWSGSARKSADNGVSWTYLGWGSPGGANLSFALRLDGNVSDTESGLA